MIKKVRIGKLFVLSLVLMMAISSVSAFGASKSSTSAPKIEKTEYEGSGRVSVDFYGKVRYSHATVTVKDSNGTKYTAKIYEKDDDDLEFRVSKIKTGLTYAYTINGIKKSGASSYTSVSAKFKVPDPKKVTVESVDYDDEDRELSIDFKNRVIWQKKRPVVKVTNTSGKSITTRFLEKDSDSIDVRTNLTYGAKYKYSISGIKAPGATSYTTVSGTFYARED